MVAIHEVLFLLILLILGFFLLFSSANLEDVVISIHHDFLNL
jgi:hypothetical protein